MVLKAKQTRRERPEKEQAIKSVGKSGTVRLNANVPEELYHRLQVIAAQKRLKITDIVIDLLDKYVSRHTKE